MVRLFFVMISGFAVGSIAFVGGLALGALVTYELMQPIFSPELVNYQTLDFPLSQTKLYMTARSWGITGDHEEVRICDAPIKFSETGNCLVFYAGELFYKRTAENGLVVHVTASTVPKDQPTRLGTVEVKVHELDFDRNLAMQRDYDQHGLMRIYAP